MVDSVKASKPDGKGLTLSLSFFNHSVSTPFQRIINKRLHPGLMAGIELRYRQTHRSKFFQTFNTGFFYNQFNGTGIMVTTDAGYRYNTKFRLSADVSLGLGYLRMYHPAAIYELDQSGTYRRTKDKGQSSALYSFAVGTGYTLRTGRFFTLTPFIRYQYSLQSPYGNPDFIDRDIKVFPHAALHIGSRIQLK